MDLMTKLSYKDLEKRLEIQETLVECIQTLYSEETDYGVSISNVLSLIADFYSADYVSIFEFNNKSREARCTYEWYSPEIEKPETGNETLYLDELDYLLKDLEDIGELFIEESKISNSENYLLELFEKWNLKNVLAVPLFLSGEICGFILVNNVERNEDSVLFLQSVAAFLLNNLKEHESFDQKILNSFSSIYISMHLVNLSDNTFHSYKCSEHIEQLLSGNNSFNFTNASEQLTFTIKTLVDEDFVQGMLKFTDLKTVGQRLGNRKIISYEFYGKVSGWCRASFIPVNKDIDGNLKYVIFSIQDIEEEKRRELEYQQVLRNTLGEQNEIYAEMLQAQSAGIFSFKRESHEIIMMNPAALNLFGWDVISSSNGNIRTIFSKIMSNKKEAIIEKILSMKQDSPEYIYEFSIKKNENEMKWVLGHAKCVLLSSHEEIIINSFTDISANKKMETELFYLSQTDALTKINNRGSGERRIELLIKKGECGMFCLFDVDKFKSINDNFGHAVGDQVLVEIAKAMKHAFRENDIIMRLGGDEFAIFATGIMSEKTGAMCIERFFGAIHMINIKALRDRKISVSLGAVFTENEGESFDQLYQRADEILYQCKKLPGCQFSFYHKLKKLAKK